MPTIDLIVHDMMCDRLAKLANPPKRFDNAYFARVNGRVHPHADAEGVSSNADFSPSRHKSGRLAFPLS